MRIISGIARGRRLFTPAGGTRAIRPTADRAREAVFNIISSAIVGSHVADLFAGTGAFGCEALSRGAASVLFVDNSSQALTLVAKNVALIADGPQRSALRRADLSKGLGVMTTTGDPHRRYDLVFADPPYGKNLARTILHLLDRPDVFSATALLIIEERKDFSPPDSLHHLIRIDSRRYGDSMFIFYRPTPPI
ncbi:16S rRNA (guanine(966)-N(2))-methyltransferase RsmD [Desulfofustis glycolicus]|uniref:16S rRNA (Guanine966-N2)-methyltransferase n=1 Tax=Desulfofustis glycolicus DSM 9705 TaxID=1121409 RepID=A0A1M5VT58_9BACT|nr:16S rRNA (guanine(966)-N(2))-methyltransferase RsmD [Desulfofustis glycolicus]SHH78436.1 16S rRNA (guanine966-N2)-methyltransferase [Desulfofustis glycolicus DSM 9705]